MASLPAPLRIANAAAVLEGPHGDVTRRAHDQGLSRQALYRDTQRVLRVLREPDPQLQPLRLQVETLQQRLHDLQARQADAYYLDEDRFAAFASAAQAE